MGLVAGWRVTEVPPDALKDGARTVGAGHAASRVRGGLLIAQIAISLVLLVGAGLLAQSVLRLLDQDPGFRREHVLTMELASQGSENDTAAERLGVNAFPLGGGAGDGRFIILSPESERLIDQTIARCGPRLASCGPAAFEPLGALFGDATQTGDAEFRVAGDGYFRAMGIPLIRGRWFDERDAAGAPHVAVISQSLATARWPGRDPIGLRIEFGNMDGVLTPMRIVGIVGDVREYGLDAPPRPTFYGSARQRPDTTATFTVAMHTTENPAAIAARARDIVRQLAPDVPAQFRTIEEVVTRSISERRVLLVLLATVGVYAAVAYAVMLRRQEFGVRMALGAQPGDIRRLVLGYAVRVAAAGLALGIAVALASSRVLASQLYGITPSDPLTYAAVALLLAAIAVTAALMPARRATGVDPLVALRTE
jgi:hypothetical protein